MGFHGNIPGLVNLKKKRWKDPGCYFHGKTHYSYGHYMSFSMSQSVSLPEDDGI